MAKRNFLIYVVALAVLTIVIICNYMMGQSAGYDRGYKDGYKEATEEVKAETEADESASGHEVLTYRYCNWGIGACSTYEYVLDLDTKTLSISETTTGSATDATAPREEQKKISLTNDEMENIINFFTGGTGETEETHGDMMRQVLKQIGITTW